MIIIFFGPPGAGKGTQALLIAKKLNIPHLSTGDILRKKLLDTDDLSQKLKKIMDSGNLVSDDILNKIVGDRLIRSDCNNGFILDGYPRTIIQNNFLINFLKNNKLSVSLIIDLKVSESTIITRIKARSNKESRGDDKLSIIKTRISKYLEETKPLSDYYSSNHLKNYHLINGNQKIEMIERDIEKIAKNKDFHQ